MNKHRELFEKCIKQNKDLWEEELNSSKNKDADT